jgi:osmotically-inducible protein OsmY
MAVSFHTDEEVQRDVLAELKWDTRVQPNEIGVSVNNGIVTLAGWVDSYAKKLAAEDAAHRVRGVRIVVNELEVHLPGSAERTDADLAKAVLDALQWASHIPVAYLEITVSQGWVTLKGEVENRYQKEEAGRVIRHISGITGITNLIKIRPHPSPADLKASIEKALRRNAELDASRITVDVEGSKAFLHGTVRSYAERTAAEETAWLAPAVSEVENHIKVSLS